AFAESVVHELKPAERINVLRSIESWAENQKPPVVPIGYSANQAVFIDDVFLKALMMNQLIQAPVEREPFESSPNEGFDGVSRGFYLLNRQESPIVVALRRPHFPSDLPHVEIVAPNRLIARTALNELLDEARRNNVYKGKVISLERLS